MYNFFHIMCNKYDCDLFHIVQGSCCPYYLMSAFGIKHCSRFIHNYTFRVHGNHTCYGNSLLLSAGKPVGRMLCIFLHSDYLQSLVYPLPDFLCRYTHIFRTESYIFFYDISDNLVIRILKDHSCRLSHRPCIFSRSRIFSVHVYSTLSRIKKRVDMLCKGRFT